MKNSKVYKVITKSVMEELKKIFPFKHRGICDDFVDAKRAGVKFDESIFENFEIKYKGTRQAR
ncbi:hypothetical protein [Sulfurimonas sp.]|uniref:hypothetical protein n=1 Tax=Sulfurimonas sp. TaxID=2022749 RepID=UPI0025CB9F42|nr:hypothetical protein [Sulfurimonas sp.]